MSYKPQDNVFITYNDPKEFKSKQNRRTVSSFASRSYRPTSKKIVLGRTLYRPFIERNNEQLPHHAAGNLTESDNKDGSSSGKSDTEQALARVMGTTLWRGSALGSPLVDPFESYPIHIRPYVPFLVDYFIRFLTPRFTPALATETSRYLVWFNVSMHNPELFHVLIALSQAYYNIDNRGFGQPHMISLYHRGEGLKQLRRKVETLRTADDDAAILTVLWLMDVDAANGDGHAFSMHKRAQEHMVSTRGGIRKLHPELQDELLKSEFFLPLLLYGSFACEVTDDDVLVRFKEHVPVTALPSNSISDFFSTITANGLVISRTVEILQSIFKQLPLEPSIVQTESVNIVGGEEGLSSQPISVQRIGATTEMSRVLQLTDQVELKTLDHRILLALFIYIFNLHNQASPHTLAPSTRRSSETLDSSRKTYLDILADVALELTYPSNTEDPPRVTEREVTLWTMVSIGSAASFSPWRLEIPFMGHMIVLLEDDTEEIAQSHHSGADLVAPGDQSSDPIPVHSKDRSNLDKLTEYLRGYYLYGADKDHLDSLQRWRG